MIGGGVEEIVVLGASGAIGSLITYGYQNGYREDPSGKALVKSLRL